jgi:hypothetical protein
MLGRYTAEPLVPGPGRLEVEIAIAKLKNYKEPIIVPIHKKGDKTDCNDYHGISLLSTSCKILSNIHLSRLSPFVDESNGSVGLGKADQLRIKFYAVVRYWRNNGSTLRQYISYS